MMIYHAGTFSNGTRYRKGLTEVELAAVYNHGNLPHGGYLESYHYVHSQRLVDTIRKEIDINGEGSKIFLDSGAFSAWSIGATTDIVAYCEYCHKNKDIIKVDKETGALMASVLDSIGNAQGDLFTYRNQKEMEARGIRALPCFHTGDDLQYLDYYVNNYDYITIGGMVGKSVEYLKKFLDRIWDKYLLDGSGRLKTKVHAFGITSPEIMARYDWTSVDSSSWAMYAAFGNIFIPGVGIIPISDKNPSRFNEGRHFDNMPGPWKHYVKSFIENLGFTWERVNTNMDARGDLNILTLGMEVASINERNAQRRKDGLIIPIQELF